MRRASGTGRARPVGRWAALWPGLAGAALLVAGAHARPAPPGGVGPVELRVSPSVIHVGDSVRVEVRVNPADGVRTPAFPAKLGAFDVLGAARADSAGQAVFRLVLTTFETGGQTVPSLAIPVERAGGVDTLRSGSWLISVESLLPPDSAAADSAKLRPAAAPLAIPGHFRWGAAFFYLALLALLFFGGRWLWARRPKRALLPAFVPAPIVRPPDAVALEALEAIAGRAYAERGLFKPHYTELMDVLRTYVEGRYAIEALDRTSPELLDGLERGGVAADFRRRLSGLLDEADLVKFARVTPDAASARTALEQARLWVRETTAAAVTPGPPATAPLPADRPAAASPTGEGGA